MSAGTHADRTAVSSRTQSIVYAPFPVELGDFGISRVLADAEGQAATVVGTPYYMAPEMFRGAIATEGEDGNSLGSREGRQTTEQPDGREAAREREKK